MPKLKDTGENAFGGMGEGGINSISVVSINKTGSIASGLNSQSDTLKIRKLQATIVENQKYDAPDHVVNSLRRRKKKGESELSLPPQNQLKDIDIDRPVNGTKTKENGATSKPKQAPEVPAIQKDTNIGAGSMDTLRSTVSESVPNIPMGMYSEGMHMPDVNFLPDDMDDLDIDDIEDISEFKFVEYARANFHGATPVYEKVLLQQPLLQHENIGDQLASLAVWMNLLRFMGDIPDATGQHGAKEYIPMMLKIYQTLGHKYSMEDLTAAQQLDINWNDANNNKTENKESGKKRHSMKILDKISKKSHSAGHGGRIKFSSYLEGGNPMLEDRKTTDLEKIQFIIGNGLLRPHLRDEILCQICKQVSNNPSDVSTSRGWVALALCLSCFAPSLDMLNYLCCFIDEGPEDYADYVAEKLDRTLMNGPRKEPPSFVELEGAQRKAMRHLTVRITLPDSTTKALLMDSASTASDVCRQLADKLGIKERVGFSLFISLYDKIMSLGSGNEHVFDAICQAEQISCEAGVPINESPWQLTFRKETFTPWYDPKEDTVGTNLIYHQVIHGIKNRDFPCKKEDDLVMITATQYYIDFGHELKPERLQNMLPLYLPEHLIKNDMEDWIKKISLAHQNCNYVKRDIPIAKAKADVVGYAKHKWPMAFTTFYEAFKYAGPRLQENDVVIGVNASGVFIFTYDGRLMIHWIFPEIATAYSSRGGKQHGQSVTIATVHNEEYTFTSPDALHVKQILALFLKGLKKRSRYVMVLQGSTKADNPSHLVFMKGDVIKIDREYEKALLNSGWCNGENLRTKARGEFRAEGIYVLPAIKEPARKMMKVISDYVSRQPLEWLTAHDHVDENRGNQPLEDYGTKSKKFSVA